MEVTDLDKILISIIMPIYNGEKTLHRAIKSITSQMNESIELILVNDGSVDNSLSICQEYANAFLKIHVINKENGGTSSAKNRGLEIASGQYISFIDCDDFVDEDTYKTITPYLLQYQPDCLDFGLKYIGVTGDITHNINKIEKNMLLTRQTIEALILPPLLNLKKDDEHFIFDFAVNKMFKAEIIQGNHIRFDEDKRTWEDRTFLLRHLKYCNTFFSMDRCFYNYVYTPNSLSQQYTVDYFKIIVQNFCHYRELYEDIFDFDTAYVHNYWATAVQNMIFHSLEQTSNKKIIRDNICEILENDLVVYWFKARNAINRFEKLLSKYVGNRDTKKAILLCQKQKKHLEHQTKYMMYKNIIKRFFIVFWHRLNLISK